MSENTPYFESITAARSLRIKDPFDTAHQTISLETQAELAKNSVSEAFREFFGMYYPSMQHLTLEDQEMLLAYYLLGQPQWCLAKLARSTQTLCSFRIRMALKKLGVITINQGPPSVEVLDRVLNEHGLNCLIQGIPTSLMIEEYRKRRSFRAVADFLCIHRPDIRRALSRVVDVLLKDSHEEHAAIGAYIHGLIDKASPSGTGFSTRQAHRFAHIHRADPRCVGEFVIMTSDPAFDDHALVSRAAHD